MEFVKFEKFVVLKYSTVVFNLNILILWLT